MKTGFLTAILVLFVLCGVASAQDYQIRTGANINLRDTYSLDGVVVEVVPSGSILQIVGQFNRWLRINRNGNTLWMADWVPFTRVGDGDQTQSQIDNCCFVDRQCTVDAEWTSGYWAFQNGQCAAPLQTGLQLPLTSIGSDSSEVNNCCFIGWQCNTDEEWLRGYWAFQNRQCKHPALTIEGSEAFVILVEEALDLLKRWAPQWYVYATSGLDKIAEDPGVRVAGSHPSTRAFTMPPTHAHRLSNRERESALINLVGGIVHEACHLHQWDAGLAVEGWRNELPCLQMQLEATEAVDPRDRFSPWLRDLIANIENPEYWWWD